MKPPRISVLTVLVATAVLFMVVVSAGSAGPGPGPAPGTELWAIRHEEPADNNRRHWGTALAVGESGTVVFVTAPTPIAYRARDGAQLWVAQPSYGTEEAIAYGAGRVR